MAAPPYGEIASLLAEGRVIPFLGAGVNFGSRPAEAVWTEKSEFLPSGAELSRYLAKQSSFPSTDENDLRDLAKVSSYFVDATARSRLRERLRQVLDRDFVPCDIHEHLAGLAAPMLLVTTNYDDLTERALRAKGRAFDLVVHPTERKDLKASVLWWRAGAAEPVAVAPNELYIDLETTTVVYKMHGSVDRVGESHDNYVITEDDYVDFLSRMTGQTAIPAIFMRHFRTRHFLFLGYGLRDWNLRVLLKNLKQPGRGRESEENEPELRSWAIQRSASELERELWESRDVKIYNVDINEFVAKLRTGGE